MSETRLEDILVKNKIRFTQPIFFNDPFEIKLSVKGLMSEEKIIKLFENKDELKEYNIFQKEKLVKEMKNITTSEIFKNKLKSTFDEKLNIKWGILSLTTKKNNLLMWAHYAHEHKGFVLELDSEHEYFRETIDKKKFLNYLHKVVYLEERNE